MLGMGTNRRRPARRHDKKNQHQGQRTTVRSAAFLLDVAREQATLYGERYRNAIAQIITDMALSLYDNLGRRRRTQAGAAQQNAIEETALCLARAADDLRTASVPDLIDDIEAAARRHPLLFLSAVAAGGVLIAHLLRADAQTEPD